MAAANKEQGRILREAMEERDKIVHEARKQAEIAAQKELDAVKQQIQIEKDEAIRDIRRQVAVLSVDIAEKVLRKSLEDKEAQMGMIDRMHRRHLEQCFPESQFPVIMILKDERQPDSSSRRTEAQATAHASGFPINVGPCIKAPGVWLEIVSAIRLLVNTAESVIYPPVSALPIHIISGSTPACSQAKSLPVRPNPVAISSKIRRISCFRQSFSASRRYCG